MLIFALGCIDGSMNLDDTAQTADDTAWQCGQEYGTVHGVVLDEYDSPVAGALVHYEEDDGLTTIEADGDGVWTIDLPAGDYVFASSDSFQECWSADAMVTVDACGDHETPLPIPECAVADKPNLYLYPERPTPTRVELGLQRKQAVVASIPEYGQGWRGVALPDGRWRQRGLDFPFLFYEVSIAPWMHDTFPDGEGWCVEGEAAVEDMAAILEDYNFNAGEVDDFVEAWRLDLPWAESYAVRPMTEVDHMAQVYMSPNLPLERLWLLVEDGAGCSLNEPAVVPFDRSGAHAVEWGVILLGLGR